MLSFYADVKRQFNAIKLRYSVILAMRRLAVIRDILYVIVAGLRA